MGRSDNEGFAELVERCMIVEARRALEEEEGGTAGVSWIIKEKCYVRKGGVARQNERNNDAIMLMDIKESVVWEK